MGHHGGQGRDGHQHRGGVSVAVVGGEDGPLHYQHQGYLSYSIDKRILLCAFDVVAQVNYF